MRTTLVLSPNPPPPPPFPRVTPLLKRDLTNFESRDLGRGRARFRIKKYNRNTGFSHFMMRDSGNIRYDSMTQRL